MDVNSALVAYFEPSFFFGCGCGCRRVVDVTKIRQDIARVDIRDLLGRKGQGETRL